jgi:glycine oxidase
VAKNPKSAVIIGGGLMGTSIAWELAQRGVLVTVLEKAVPGAEASSAAAGILGAETEASGPGPMLDLCRYSQALYPAWIRKLQEATRVSVGYLEGGCVEVAFDKETLTTWKKKRAFQLRSGAAQLLSKAALHALEPLVSPRAIGGVFLPTDARITPRDLFSATHIAAEKAGVLFKSGAYVQKIIKQERTGRTPQVSGVELVDGQKELV